MMASIKKMKFEVNATRNVRNINIANSAIPLCKDNRDCVNALFYKSLNGNLLIALNAANQPVRAWRDICGIVPIRSKVIPSTRFRKILCELEPKILYLNDGELLKPLPTCKSAQLATVNGNVIKNTNKGCSNDNLANCILKLYTNKNLMEILKSIRITDNNNTMSANTTVTTTNKLTSPDDDDKIESTTNTVVAAAVAAANNNARKSKKSTKQDVIDRPPSYEDMCIMDPGITKKEYRKFYKQFQKQLTLRL